MHFLNSKRKVALLKTADIIIFSTQECSNSILKSFCCNSKYQWSQKIKRLLRNEFELLTEKSLNALYTVIYVKKNIREEFIEQKPSSTYLGMNGILPNKAIIFLSFLYKNKRFLAINLHFPHGSFNSKKRFFCVNQLVKKLKYHPDFKNFHYAFLMGDFNFRTQLDYRDLIYMSNKGKLNLDFF